MSKTDRIRTLATDMDGTFIPLHGNSDNVRDLDVLFNELKHHSIDLMYVTGRDFELAKSAIAEHALPLPNWMICDVGSSIYHFDDRSDQHVLLGKYQGHLRSLVGSVGVDRLAEQFATVEALRQQESSKQGEFKLSYYVDANRLLSTTDRLNTILRQQCLPYELVTSVDPFTDDGLIDIMPTAVSKAYALSWWATVTGRDQESIVFAGDSGNDFAALTAGYRSIIVGNASEELVHQVRQAHESAEWDDRLHVASRPATSGVLEGLRNFVR